MSVRAGRRGGTPRSLHDRALGLLAVRPRSRRELRDRLLRAGVEAAEVDEELVGVAEGGLGGGGPWPSASRAFAARDPELWRTPCGPRGSGPIRSPRWCPSTERGTRRARWRLPAHERPGGPAGPPPRRSGASWGSSREGATTRPSVARPPALPSSWRWPRPSPDRCHSSHPCLRSRAAVNCRSERLLRIPKLFVYLNESDQERRDPSRGARRTPRGPRTLGPSHARRAAGPRRASVRLCSRREKGSNDGAGDRTDRGPARRRGGRLPRTPDDRNV